MNFLRPFKKFAAVMVLAISMFSSQSHAFLVLDLAINGDHPRRVEYPILAIAVCVFFLPFCILDGDADGAASVDQLVANGYDLAEAQATVAGQQALLEHLRVNQQAIKANGEMNKEQLIQLVGRVEGMTPQYLQYLNETL
jgi:hypothetical protein